MTPAQQAHVVALIRGEATKPSSRTVAALERAGLLAEGRVTGNGLEAVYADGLIEHDEIVKYQAQPKEAA